jgi:hypothetical protein
MTAKIRDKIEFLDEIFKNLLESFFLIEKI